MSSARTLRIGILGFGFMGRMHYRCWKSLDGAEVVAVAESDTAALGDAGRNRGNVPGAEAAVDLAGIHLYSDLPSMLAAEKLDAVSLAVPTHLHPECTLAALAAGVHVLCEKPIALNLADARRMVAAARESRRVLQIGHCIRFWPEYVKAKEIVDSGVYGKVIAASFLRLAATAARRAGTWFVNEEASGGMPLDLHIHDTDFIQYLFGMPRAVSSGGALTEVGLDHIATRYDYGDRRLITAEGGWALTPGFGFTMRFHLVLEQATIDFQFPRDPALVVYPAEGEKIIPVCPPGDGYVREIEHFARRIRGQEVPPLATPESACDSLRIVLAERESVRRGCPVALESFGLEESNHAV